MPTLRWDRLGWAEFLDGLWGYRRRIAAGASEDRAYIRCIDLLEGLSFESKAAEAEGIVSFRNSWRCRVSRVDAAQMLAAWIREHQAELEVLSALKILDVGVPETCASQLEPYEDLCSTGRGQVHNWSDAAASKTLYQLLPELFVMWDDSIKRFATDYGDFMLEMNSLALRLVSESPFRAEEVEGRLQDELGYKALKSLPKYLDEYNWWVMVGAGKIR